VQHSDIVDHYLRALDLHRSNLDFDFLTELVRRHVATFAFSSVACRLGEDLPLDFESLFDRIVVRRRGGYCFEQNGFLYEVLERLGFAPTLYLARVIYNQDIHPGLTHRISVVEHDGTVDGDRVFRVSERNPGEFHMQVRKDGGFFSLSRFEFSRYGQADCELGHFYSHRHPKASFVNHLVVSRILEDEIRSLRDLEYRVIKTNSEKIVNVVSSPQLRQILAESLGIHVTKTESCTLFDRSST
jgi:N-hydroxyarylamine O-acetyltransferase